MLDSPLKTLFPIVMENIVNIVENLFQLERRVTVITKDELLEMKRQLDSNRIWNGMGWTYNPVHYFKYKKILDIINRELEAISPQEGGQ